MERSMWDDWRGEQNESQPWWTFTVVMALLLTLLIWPLISTSMFLVSGIPQKMYGKDYVESLNQPDSPTAKQATLRISLWPMVFGFPIQAILLPLVFWMVHRTRPHEMNLSAYPLWDNLLMGFVTWIGLSLLTLGIHFAASKGYEWLIPSGSKPHIFEELVRGNELWPVEKVLIVFEAMCGAAFLEELVFRGVLLRWARQQPYASDVLVGIALLASIPTDKAVWDAMLDMQDVFQRQDIKTVLDVCAPLIWASMITLLYVVITWRNSSGPAARIVATAFLFAAFHGAWPSPVPLFILALGLGMLAERTKSLVGPVLVHCLFNGIACAQMFLL